MRGIHRWLAGVSMMAFGTASFAQLPGTLPTPITESSPLPGGTVVGSLPGVVPVPVPTGDVLVIPPAPVGSLVDLPLPIVTVEPIAAEADTKPAPLATLPGGNDAAAPLMYKPVPPPTPGAPANCCGPIGADGPIGAEIYARGGVSYPIEDGFLSRNLKLGHVLQVGGRSLFFDPSGSTAWAVDLQFMFSHHAGKSDDVVTVAGEPVIIRALTRYAVGVGIGRDWFLAGPGFILDTWDLNFRGGFDVGGRYGTGHVDFAPFLEGDGYRRNHDVFGQAFAGVHGTIEIPMGGYTALVGGRIEWDYTFSDFLERGSSFQEVMGLLSFGVRY